MNDAHIRTWMPPEVAALQPYYEAPVEGGPLRLDQNTNLSGHNPALDAVDLATLDATQYPTRDGDLFRGALARFHGLLPDYFVGGNGSDEILDIVLKAFTSPGDTLATTDPCYSLYPYYAAIHRLRLRRTPWGERLDAGELSAKPAKVVLVASPDNPTGRLIPQGAVEHLLDEHDGPVVVDEAYIEYSERASLVAAVDDHPNLIVVRTMSKAHGLAALRVGYAAACPAMATILRTVKPPFNVDLVSEKIAAAALDQPQWMHQHVKTVTGERGHLTTQLTRRGFNVTPTHTNFILTTPPMDAGALWKQLLSRGVLARIFPDKPTLHDKIRFTIGHREHTDTLLAAIDEVSA